MPDADNTANATPGAAPDAYVINGRAVSAPAPPTTFDTVLRGEYIRLEPLDTDDRSLFQQLYRATHGDAVAERVWKYMFYGPFANAEKMRECYREMSRAGDPFFYSVWHSETNQPQGIVSFLRIDPAHYSIEVGHIWHAPAAQRTTANTEAIFLMMNYVFSNGYRRFEWKCDALNTGSRRAALRLGFSFEGVFRQHYVIKERNRDTAWFALLAQDFPPIRDNFNRWLKEPGSFSLAQHNRPHVQWSVPFHEYWSAESSDV